MTLAVSLTVTLTPSLVATLAVSLTASLTPSLVETLAVSLTVTLARILGDSRPFGDQIWLSPRSPRD